jgi:hypothetical protein
MFRCRPAIRPPGGGPIAVAACRLVDTTQPGDDQFYDKVPKQFLYWRRQAAAWRASMG